MKEIKIKVPDVAHIVISGPTQCGKSIVKNAFSVGSATIDLDIEVEGD